MLPSSSKTAHTSCSTALLCFQLPHSLLLLQVDFLPQCRQTQDSQAQALEAWAQFIKKQCERYVPAPFNPTRRTLPETQGYRLRILRVSELPNQALLSGSTYEFQLGISLYDENLGAFYGSTCYSLHDAPSTLQPGAAGAATAEGGPQPRVDVDFSFDVYYHSAISDPSCMAVVSIAGLFTMYLIIMQMCQISISNYCTDLAAIVIHVSTCTVPAQLSTCLSHTCCGGPGMQAYVTHTALYEWFAAVLR